MNQSKFIQLMQRVEYYRTLVPEHAVDIILNLFQIENTENNREALGYLTRISQRELRETYAYLDYHVNDLGINKISKKYRMSQPNVYKVIDNHSYKEREDVSRDFFFKRATPERIEEVLATWNEFPLNSLPNYNKNF